jgi:hypothetical protein
MPETLRPKQRRNGMGISKTVARFEIRRVRHPAENATLDKEAPPFAHDLQRRN